MSARSIPGIVAIMLGVMVAADLVGVAASFILDVAPARNKSAGLGYAIWLVLGVFGGVVAFGAASEGAANAQRPVQDRRGRARLVLAVAAIVIAGLITLFAVLFWRDGRGGSFAVVPDHMPTSMVFFASFFAACIVGYVIETDSGETDASAVSKDGDEARE
jgi:hypothetical protein